MERISSINCLLQRLFVLFRFVEFIIRHWVSYSAKSVSRRKRRRRDCCSNWSGKWNGTEFGRGKGSDRRVWWKELNIEMKMRVNQHLDWKRKSEQVRKRAVECRERG
jgi:hypothetical protein